MKNSNHYKIINTVLFVAAVLTFNTFTDVAPTGTIQSVGAMTFADTNTLILADWRASEIHALQFPPAANVTSKPFNLKNVSSPIAKALHTEPDKLLFEDMVIRPGAALACITISVGA